MKLSEIKRDVQAIEQGQWVGDIPEMPGLRLKVRGQNNADWRRIQSKLVADVPRYKRIGGRIDQDEQDRISSTLFQSACLIDWDGLEDDEGNAIPYSKDKAGDLLTLPEFRAFRDAVAWASTLVGDATQADATDATKN